MDKIQKIKEWIRENIPSLLLLFENKYVGMVYDRYASLPSKQQRQLFLGGIGSIVGVVFFYILLAYWSLWSSASRTNDYKRMTDMIYDHQRVKQEQDDKIKELDRNGPLASNGELKKFLQDQSRTASISNKLIEVDEKPERPAPESGQKGIGQAKIKEATVVLNRITLAQLKNYLMSVEFGQFNLRVSSLKITNDDKLRGYMKAEFSVAAYLFAGEDSSG